MDNGHYNSENRATAESVLAILPVVAMVVVIAFGGMIDAIGGYPVFFFAIGGFVIVCGILGLFTLKDSRSGVHEKTVITGRTLFTASSRP